MKRVPSSLPNHFLVCIILLLILSWTNKVYSQCGYPPGDITLNAAGGNTNPFYTTQYVLVDNNGNIVQFQSTPTFTNITQGEYSAYAIDYKTSDGITGLTIGDPFSGLASDCLDISPGFPFSVGKADATLAVSDVTVCNPATSTADIIITNAQAGFTYELQTTAGASFSPAITGVGTGSDLTLTIPQANLPASTTTYKVVASLSGCSDTDLTDQPVVTVEGPLTVTTQPSDAATCETDNATFTTVIGNAGAGTIVYQWQESTDGGSSFNNINDGGVYSGTTTASLLITGATIGMDTYQYQLVASTSVCNRITSTPATLNISNLPTANAGSDSNVCDDFGAFDLSTITTLSASTFGTINWTADNGNATPNDEGTFTNGTTNTPSYTPSVADIASGTVTLTMTVTGTDGTCTGRVDSDDMVLMIDICCNAVAPALSGN